MIVRRATFLLLLTVVSSVCNADPGADGWLAEGQLEIQGNRLTLFATDEVNHAFQVVSVGQPTTVRTCFGGTGDECVALQPGDLRIAGLSVLADLRGPELPEPLPMQAYPGGAFLIPGFQQKGSYFLENIRLVDDASGRVLGMSVPAVAEIQVHQILLTSATVTTLSLEDLEARGITLGTENYQAFSFSVGFAFEGVEVSFEMPMIFTSYGVVQPLERPSASLDGLPPDVAYAVSRWQPPTMVPFSMEAPPDLPLERSYEADEVLSFPMFGAIVMPGSVSFLNQYSDVRLIIANGAPEGSGVQIAEISAGLNLPAGDPLRLAETEPPVAPGQDVPLLTESGQRVLEPTDMAAATWTVEGLEAGTHALVMDIQAELRRPGREPFPLRSRTQAAVEVVDARFNLTFSHPDVVRENTEYSLFVTVTNLSRATQNDVKIEIDEQHLTNTSKADASDDFVKSVGNLVPGQSNTVEYRLRSSITGRVGASTLETDSGTATGDIVLHTGVGELGIPLSPASLVLPAYTDFLLPPYTPTKAFFLASIDFLGLSYSLANAPAGRAPAGLPRVITSDVRRRAIDLAEAGQRIFLQDEMLASLEVLVLDLLGNREHLAESDELMRSTDKGGEIPRALGELVRWQQQAEKMNLGAADLFDHFVETTSYAEPYIAAALIPATGPPSLEIELRRTLPDGTTLYLAYDSDAAQPLRTLPFGEIFAVSRQPGSLETVPFAVVGHVETAAGEEELFQLFFHNQSDSEVGGDLRVALPVADSGRFRTLDFGVITLAPHSVVGVDLGAHLDAFDLYTVLGAPFSGGPSPSIQAVSLPPFEIIGAVQTYDLNGAVSLEPPPDGVEPPLPALNYGQSVLYLFNRPPDPASLGTGGAFVIDSVFDGLNVEDEAVIATSRKMGTAAHAQDDGRVVAVRYSGPVCSLLNDAADAPLVVHSHLVEGAAILDHWANSLSSPVPDPIVETNPQHFGGLVDGLVIRGTGEAVPGASVQLLRPREVVKDGVLEIVLDMVASTVTDIDGHYFFELVEEPFPQPGDRSTVLPYFTVRVDVPEGEDPSLEPAEKAELRSAIRRQNRVAHVNFALPGRGTISGRFVHADTGEPVTSGRVACASPLFNEPCGASIVPADNGYFQIPAVAVGPVVLTGVSDGQKARAYRTVALTHAGQHLEVMLELDRDQVAAGFGTVTGRVMLQRAGEPGGELPEAEPVVGAGVQLTAATAGFDTIVTDSRGGFVFEDVPAGMVGVQAADWRVSRTSQIHDLLVHADQVVDLTLTLFETPPSRVVGRVTFDDPVSPGDPEGVAGALVAVDGLGISTNSDENGRYVFESVPAPGLNETFSVSAFDMVRSLSGSQPLPNPMVPEVELQDIVLREMLGGLTGVVLDPFGAPAPGVDVVVGVTDSFGYAAILDLVTGADGSFSVDRLPLGAYKVTAHVGDGLQPGFIGFLGEAETRILSGGHRPFVTVQMMGSGAVNLTVTSPAQDSYPVYFKSTYFSTVERQIRVQGAYSEISLVSNTEVRRFDFPVGAFEFVTTSPFYGTRSVVDRIDYPGKVKNVELVFAQASTVVGGVVDVDGVTPVAGLEIELHTSTLLPQKQITDALGGFRFELVPSGPVAVTAAGLIGSVERVGAANGIVTGSGQTLELLVAMKAQGTVRGRIREVIDGQLVPVAHARVAIQEQSYPFRRLPAQGWYTTDAVGHYEQSHVYAGHVTVFASDPDLQRGGRATGEITADWQIAELPDVVFSKEVGAIEVVVRDPNTGAPVADCVVHLDHPDLEYTQYAVTDGSGEATYLALPSGGGYSMYAFHAPTGRSGRREQVAVQSTAEPLVLDLYLDSWGKVHGTLFDGALDPPQGVPGGVVRLDGSTASGSIAALTTTTGEPRPGSYEIPGIPEGTFRIAAGLYDSPRKAGADVSLSADSPVQQVDLFLEPQDDLYFQVLESLSSGLVAMAPADGAIAVTLESGIESGRPPAYSRTKTISENGLFRFEEALPHRDMRLTARELVGEQRSVQEATASPLERPIAPGQGTEIEPFQVVLRPKGTVIVRVIDAVGLPVSGANLTLFHDGRTHATVTDAGGLRSFYAVSEGTYNVVATTSNAGRGGSASGTIRYDDDLFEHTIQLNPTVSAQGAVFQPVPGDIWDGNPATKVPMPGAIVEIFDGASTSVRTSVTDARGVFRFDAMLHGRYKISARDASAQAMGHLWVDLAGVDGTVNAVPDLILDGAPPRMLSSMPSPGMEDVSLTATIEIVFSEPLASEVAVDPGAFFGVESEHGGFPLGAWICHVDDLGRQVVRFVLQIEPTVETFENLTTYSVTVRGGIDGVRDRADRPLTEHPLMGWHFTTSDQEGARVINTEPELIGRVDPVAPIRFDLSEAVTGTAEQLDPNHADATARLLWGSDDGIGGVDWDEDPIVIALSLTRSGYSLVVDPYDGISLPPEALHRRVEISGLADLRGNEMEAYSAEFRIYDENSPVLESVSNPGQLSQGMTYALAPQISGVDDLTPENPGGDIARVDYFFEEPGLAETSPRPGYSAVDHPFTLDFVAAMTPTGEFPVWVRAVDTSSNWSNTVLVEMVVVANSLPTIGAVTVVPSDPFAGGQVMATASGLDDDGAQVTLAAELWEQDGSAPLMAIPGLLLQRPGDGWSSLTPPTFSFAIPLDLQEGTSLYVRVTATDSQGATAARDSAPFAVADDGTAPAVNSLVAVAAGDGAPSSLFYVGDFLSLEMRVSELETAVQRVVVVMAPDPPFPGSFATTHVAALVAGTSNLYRTPVFSVPSDISETVVQVTASADDFGGNTGTSTIEVTFAPVPDASAPTVEWLTPWEGAPWPADHDSQISSDGTVLLLRVSAQDSADAGGFEPEVTQVLFFVPELGAGGELVLSGEGRPGVRVPGTDIWQFACHVPDLIPAGTVIPFAVRVVDNASLDVRRDIRLEARTPRLVVEGGATVATFVDGQPIVGQSGDPGGPVFILDGGALSLYPNGDGSVRELPSVYLYPGSGSDGVHSSRLTAPKVTTYSTLTKFHPFELAVVEELAIGHACRLDLEGRGLLGNTGTEAALLSGQVGPEPYAGGSHGGRGWYGSDGGWDRDDIHQPAAIYDSVRRPSLPGIGGWISSETSQGDGGGVVTVLADGATLKLVGDIVADGLPGIDWSGGGAGGAVYVEAGTIEGQGLIRANGGAGGNPAVSGGGGGGRIAVYARTLAAGFDLGAQIQASGGGNGGTRLAGAGTIYIETLDAVGGEVSGFGELRVSNPDNGLPAALSPLPSLGSGAVIAVDAMEAALTLDITEIIGDPVGEWVAVSDGTGAEVAVLPITRVEVLSAAVVLTVAAAQSELDTLRDRIDGGDSLGFSGRSRFTAITGSGATRVVFGDDVEVVPADGPTSVNDRSALVLTGDARALMPGETTSLTATVVPPAGAEIRVGSQVALSWGAQDPLGLQDARLSWTFDESPLVLRNPDQPLATGADPDPMVFTVPPEAPPGVARLEMVVTTIDGRTAARNASWIVLANSGPSGALVLDGPSAVQAGFSTRVMVDAQDIEGLASLTLNATGPAAQTQWVVVLGGTESRSLFTVDVAPTADGAEDIQMVATITDSSGATVTTNTLVIDVLPDASAPLVGIDLNPASVDDVYTAGDDVLISISATDDVAVTSLTATFGEESWSTAGDPIESSWIAPSVSQTTTMILSAWAVDPSGNRGEVTRTITVEPLVDPDAPVVSILCPADGDFLAPGVAIEIAFELSDEDTIDSYALVVNGQPIGEAVDVHATAVSGAIVWTPPATAQPGESFDIRIEAQDYVPNSGFAAIATTAVGGTVLDGDQTIDSNSAMDLVLANGTFTAIEDLALSSLTLLSGAKVQTVAPTPVRVEVEGDLRISCGSTIDVSGQGYAAGETYPGASPPGATTTGASHVGQGGIGSNNGAPASTYGSVYRPQEAGGGALNSNPGGGVVRLTVDGEIRVDGEILANGDPDRDRFSTGGAGGSIWISAPSLSGSGSIEARGSKGGWYEYGDYGSGGGGAVAIEVESITGPIADRLWAGGGSVEAVGGAGTVYLYDRTTSEYGTLLVDNGDVEGTLAEEATTILPALGSGVAVAGTVGPILAIDRAEAIPSYFTGHWIEVYSDQTGTNLKGTWRIAAIGDGTITLEIPEGETEAPVAGDWWQGVYRFDSIEVSSGGRLISDDPIRASAAVVGRIGVETTLLSPIAIDGSVTIAGTVAARSLSALDLLVSHGSVLTHPVTSNPESRESLELRIGNDLTIENGASIDVSGRGYPAGETHPGETPPGATIGASHTGQGGNGRNNGAPASTYGSVYRPQEAGGGALDSNPGGGVVRLAVDGELRVDGEILANGDPARERFSTGGAGGSIWISAVGLIGSGSIQANGSAGGWYEYGDYGSGGGGAIAIDYGSISGSIADPLEGLIQARGGPVEAVGGAGTVVSFDRSSSEFGTLVVENGYAEGTLAEEAMTILPALGSGAAVTGTVGPVLVTDRVEPVPAYFVGHWVEVFAEQGAEILRGTWRIAAVEGATIFLDLPEGETQTPVPGDWWQGVYRFDSLDVRGNANLVVGDMERVSGEIVVEGGSTLVLANRGGPTVEPTGFSLWAEAGSFWIGADEQSVEDSDGVASVLVANVAQPDLGPWQVTLEGGGFASTAIAGVAGNEIEVTATDGHPDPKSSSVVVGILPANSGPPEVNVELIRVVEDASGNYMLVGDGGAVVDGELPIDILVTVVDTGASFSGTVGSDSSFEVVVVGSGNQSLSLVASDGHPQTLSTGVSGIWTLPGNDAPSIDPDGIFASYEDPGVYVIHVATAAIVDDDEPITVAVSDGSAGWSTVIASGAATDITLTGSTAGTGDSVTLTATDSHASDPASEMISKLLPVDNYGPPEVNVSNLQLLPMGFGFQIVGGAPGWVSDADWPVSVTIVNASTDWQSQPVTVLGESEPLYSHVEGSVGDAIQMVVTDGHAELPLTTDPPIDLGVLPDGGVVETEIDLGGHTVSAVRGNQIALLDGGALAAWISSDVVWYPLYDGLTEGGDLQTLDSMGNEITVIDGGDVVTWSFVQDGDGNWVGTPVSITVASGTLTRMEVIGDDLLMVAEESDGIRFYRLPGLSFLGGPDTVGPMCGPTREVLLPGTAGMSALEIVPIAGDAVGVVVDDAAAELRLIEIDGTGAPVNAGTIDADWPFNPTWAKAAGADVFVGRDDGGVELWRWTGVGLDPVVAWTPAQGNVTCAARMGEHLWLGMDTGMIEQVAMRDPSAPISVGGRDLGHPVRDIERSGTALYVAATQADDSNGRLVRLDVVGVPTGIAHERVTWGHDYTYSGRTTWAAVAPLEDDVATVRLRWSNGEIASCSTPDNGCSFSTSGELADPPMLWAEGVSSVRTAPCAAASLPMRTLDPVMGARLHFEYQMRPEDGCAVAGASHGWTRSADGSSVAWVAYRQAGTADMIYAYVRPADNRSDRTTIAATGQPVAVFGRDDDVLVAADDLEMWNLDGLGGGDPFSPVKAATVELFAGDPISVATYGGDTMGYDLILAAENPTRFAVVDPNASMPGVDIDDVVLPLIEGRVLDLTDIYAGTVSLIVLTDAGTAGRLYAYDIDDASAPNLLGQVDLIGSAPGSALAFNYGCDGSGCFPYVLVVRRGWGVEAYGADLGLLASVPLPGDARDVHWTHDGAAIALGDLGVAVVRDLFGDPVVSFVRSNASPPGKALSFTDQGSVLTPEGISWVEVELQDLQKVGRWQRAGQAGEPGTPTGESDR